MDALHERNLVKEGEGDQEAGALVARRGARRPILGRGWFAATLATLGLLTGAWLSFIEMPLAFTVAEGPSGAMVESVGVGSLSWIAGVRPQMDAEWANDGRQLRVLFAPERWAGFQPHLPGNFPTEVMLGVVLAIGAAILALARLPGAPLAAGAGVAIALAPALPHLGLPAAVPLVLISTATAAAATRIPDRGTQRLFDVFSLLVLATIVAGAVALMSGGDDTAWSLVWAAGLGIAIALGALGELAAARTRFKLLPKLGQTRASRLLAAFVPLAAKSRIEGGDEERSRLAIELHNRVLPSMELSAREIRDDGSADAADRLEALAADLRGVMKQHETVTLESGGVGPALRAHMEGMSAHGLRLAFQVRDGGQGRPPADVELAAYRIGQAAIDNALRHSGGEAVEVSVFTARDRLKLIVRDDGVGIRDGDEENARRQGRLGLAQMWLRAEAVGGSLDIRNRTGEGTEVRFTWAP